jgi:hypothetical protein
MKRRLLAVGMLLASAASAAVEGAVPSRAPHEAALRRLEASVRERLARTKGRPTLGWLDALRPPDADRLAWGARTVRLPAERGRSWRVAIDLRTQWFYVAEAGGAAPPRFFGPIDEAREGVFVDVGAALPPTGAGPPVARAEAKPKRKPVRKSPAQPKAPHTT